MMQSVVISKKLDGSWQALHVPSKRVVHGLSKEEAEESMRTLLGMKEEGGFDEPATSGQFTGIAEEIAQYLEGPVSEMLAMHSGFARLDAFADGIAHIRLGGGCQGCPSSIITLTNGVKRDLQAKFGEETIIDVLPISE